MDSLRRLANEIQSVLIRRPQLRLVIGHGSGSSDHQAAAQDWAPHPYPPPEGASTRRRAPFWRGFEEVWYRASQLNRHVVEALREAGIPVVPFPAFASACAEGGQITEWDTGPIERALECALVPLIYGDIVIDAVKGGTILSTEMLMFTACPASPPAEVSCWLVWKPQFGPIFRFASKKWAL